MIFRNTTMKSFQFSSEERFLQTISLHNHKNKKSKIIKNTYKRQKSKKQGLDLIPRIFPVLISYQYQHLSQKNEWCDVYAVYIVLILSKNENRQKIKSEPSLSTKVRNGK